MTGKKILVIEDDESIRESIKDLLGYEGYIVECATNGEEGLTALRQSGVLPQMILLDLMMPIKDGFQFRLEQKQDPKFAHIPVVIMTADGHIEEKSKKIGARAYLHKPIDIDAIIRVVKQCCL